MTICCSLIQTQTLAMIISGKKYICFCEPIWWASTQRAALYHSQPPVGFCPWPVTSHIPAMLACLQWTGAHQLDSALALASVIWLLYDTQSKIPLDRLTQGLTQIPPTLTQLKKKKKPICEQSHTRFHSFSSTNIMNMNNPLAQILASCTIRCCVQAFKMSTQRQKGKLRNKSNNTVWASNRL